ncbi:FG-GAP repeat domain-containing protein [Microbacterium sp. P5_E9]
MTEIPTIVVEAELTQQAADRAIERAVKGRPAVARQYVRWVRRAQPEATPAQLIASLSRHYITAISAEGAIVAAAAIAVETAIALAVDDPAKPASGGAMKAAAKGMAKDAAKSGAPTALVAADQKLQFELTAMYALALADIHSMSLDKAQMRALVLGLSNGRVSQGQIAAMAADLARSQSSSMDVGKNIASGRQDWSHWAETLAHSLPAGAAQELVRGVETGRLEQVRTGLGTKKQGAIEYGVGAVVGGVTQFQFGRHVVAAAQEAFAQPPTHFPAHLSVAMKEKPGKVDEPNRAVLALQEAARSTARVAGGSAHAIGTGVGAAAGTVTRPFRSVDLDGDGIPDAPRALTAVKGAGSKIAGGASAATSPFRSVDLDGDGIPDAPRALTAVRGAGSKIAGGATAVAGKVSNPVKRKAVEPETSGS